MRNKSIDKIIFMSYDDLGKKIYLEKNMNLKDISEKCNSKDDVLRIHFNFNP